MAEELWAVLLPHESLCCLLASLAVAFGRLSYFGSSIMHGEIIWMMDREVFQIT